MFVCDVKTRHCALLPLDHRESSSCEKRDGERDEILWRQFVTVRSLINASQMCCCTFLLVVCATRATRFRN